MEELDFSVDGMIKMQLHNSDKIYGWLMNDTMKVKSSLLNNLKKNPEKGEKLIRNFGFLVRKHVFITEKQVFLERWNRVCVAEIFALALGKIDTSLINELNNCVGEICSKAEDELLEAYQDQRIDPANKHIEIRENRITPFEYFLVFEKKEELIGVLKDHFPNCTGAACARMIIALRENEALKLPVPNQLLYNSIKNEWGIKKFDEWGVSKKIKKYWADINEEWYINHKTKIEYTSDVIVEIEYLKIKIKDMQLKR